MTPATVRRAACLLLAVGLVGCSSGKQSDKVDTPTTGDALLEVASMIRDYASTHNHPPAKVADFAPYEHLYIHGYKAVKSGDVVVIWGATVAGEGGGGSESVIAYEKTAPDSGGAVLMENGKVKQMTAAEFGSAPKARKK
jgi:hypothetical protein